MKILSYPPLNCKIAKGIAMLCISLGFATQSVAQVKLNANSNLGIGIGATTAPNPAYKLHIMDYVTMGPFNNQTFARGLLFSRINNPTSLDGIDWGIDTDCGGMNFWRPWSVANFGNCKFIIKDNGNVGINMDPLYPLDVNGYVRALNVPIPSDSNLKENIRAFNTTLDKLMELKPVEFNYKTIYNDQSSSSKEEFKGMKIKVEDERLYRNTSGFLAQDVQKIFPDMVQKNEDGTLSIYTFDWFPIIVKSLQELNDKVDEKLGVSSGERIGIINTNASLLPAEPKTINTPTVLNYRLPSTFKRAQMLLYSFDGKELAQYELAQNSNQIAIENTKLYAGIYYYTLLVDDKEVATHKLIITSK